MPDAAEEIGHVLTGADGTEFRLSPGENLVGRFGHCDIVIEDERVAGEHCRIVIDGGEVTISAVGDEELLVAGKPVGEDPARLEWRTAITLGDMPLTFSHVERTRRVRVKGWLRRARRAVLWLAGIVLVGLVLVVLAAPLVFNAERARRRIVEALEGTLHRQVTIGEVDVKILKARIEIRGLEIANKTDFTPTPLVKVPSATVTFAPWRYIFSLGSKLHTRISIRDPEVFIERNSTGRMNVADIPGSLMDGALARALLHPDSLGMDAGYSDLKMRLRVYDALVRFRDDLVGANSEVRNIQFRADLDSIESPLDYELAFKMPVGGKPGEVTLSGTPNVLRHRRIGPGTVKGPLATLEIRDLDPATVLRHFGCERLARTVSGKVELTADGLDALVHKGSLLVEGLSLEGIAPAGEAPHPPRIDVTLVSEGITDVPGRTHSTEGTSLNCPLGRVDIEGTLGSEAGSVIRATYKSSAEKISSGELGRALGFATPLEGNVSVEMTAGGGPDRLSLTVEGAVSGLRPKGAAGTDEISIYLDSDVSFDADGALSLIRVTDIEIESDVVALAVDPGSTVAFAEADVATDAAGTVRIDLGRLTGRYGAALGLPAIRERVSLAIDARGDHRKVSVTGTAVSHRTDAAAPDPIRLEGTAVLDRAVSPYFSFGATLASPVGEYAEGRLTGSAREVEGGTEAELKLTGSVEIAELLDRLRPLPELLAELKPTGSARIELLSLKSTPEGLESQGSLKFVDLEVERGAKFREGLLQCIFNVARDPGGEVRLRTLRLSGPTGRLSVTGSSADGTLAGVKAEISAGLNVKRAIALLEAMSVIDAGVELTGTAAAEGRLDLSTPAPSLTVRRFNVDTPPLEASGSASVRGSTGPPESTVTVKGTLNLRELTEALGAGKPEGLTGAGEVRFAASAKGRGGAFSYDLSFEAGKAGVELADLLVKSEGTPAHLSAAGELRLSRDLRKLAVQVERAKLSVGAREDRIEAVVAGRADRDGGLDARVSAEGVSAAGLARLVPATGRMKLGGRLGFALRVRSPLAPLAELGTAAWKRKLLLDGTVSADGIEASHPNRPDFLLRLSGEMGVAPRSIEGKKLAVELVNRASARRNRLAVEKLSLNSRPKSTIVADLGRLTGSLVCASDAIDLDEILRSLRPPRAAPAPRHLEAFEGIELSGSLRIGSLRWGRHEAKDVACRLKLAESAVHLQGLAGAAYGGGLSGDVSLDLRGATPVHRGKVALTGASLGDITTTGRPATPGEPGGEGAAACECKGKLDLQWSGTGPLGKSLAGWNLRLESTSSAGTLAWERITPLAAALREFARALGREKPFAEPSIAMRPAKLIVTLRQGTFLMPPATIDLSPHGAYRISGRMDAARKLSGEVRLARLPAEWRHPLGATWTAATKSLTESGAMTVSVSGTPGSPRTKPPALSARVAAAAAISAGAQWTVANRAELAKAGLRGEAAAALLKGRPRILRALGDAGE